MFSIEVQFYIPNLIILFLSFFRTHSLAIGQVLLDAFYIESLTSNSIDFIDGIVFYKFTEMAFKSNEIDSSPARKFIFDCIMGWLLLMHVLTSYFPCHFHTHEQISGEIVARSLVEGNTSTSQSGFRLDLNIHKNTAHISRHPQKSGNNKGESSE